MAKVSPMLEALHDIRDEMRATRIDLATRIDATNERLDRVERRQVETDVRLGTAIAELQGATRQNTEAIRALISVTQDHNARIDNILIGPLGNTVRDVEREVGELKQRVVRLENERHTG